MIFKFGDKVRWKLMNGIIINSIPREFLRENNYLKSFQVAFNVNEIFYLDEKELKRGWKK